jgi:glyoxylase-like metal-dependent hydrolase (beta-lactamase superfamily II)
VYRVGTTETLERGIWLTRVALDDYDVRGALILGTERAVVWDTLARPANMRPFLPFIGSRELVVVYSHADWDHIWGTAGLPSPARIVSHTACRQRFDGDVPSVLADKQRAEPGQWDDVVLHPPIETFDDEWSIDLGGLTLTLHHLPGHTRDCIVGFIPERGILLAGDTAETPCPVVPLDSPLDGWIAGLRRWSSDARVHRVVPAHGPVGGREILEANVAYLEGIRTGNPAPLAGPLTAFYRETHARNLRWGQGT